MSASNDRGDRVAFKRMNRVSISEEIVRHVKELITSNRLKPGEQLPSEEKIAAQMGVGRGTAREALKVLIYLGLIERRKKGTYVSHLAPERVAIKDISEKFQKHRDIMEMIEVRKVIEPQAALLAAERASEQQITGIEEQYRLMVEARHDVERFIYYDNRFHLQVIQATGNNLIKEIMESIQQLLKKNQAVVLHRSRTIMPRSLGYHLQILEAIKSRDKIQARKRMLNHILDVQKEMYLILKEEQDG